MNPDDLLALVNSTDMALHACRDIERLLPKTNVKYAYFVGVIGQLEALYRDAYFALNESKK